MHSVLADDRRGKLCDAAWVARDPKFALEVMIAYLRLAVRDGGLPLDVPGGRAYTNDLRAMVERGDLVMLRAARGSNRPDVLHTTPQGVDRLASVLERYGDDFGPVTILGQVENVRGR
jgi:hypothetical protein